MIAIFLRVVILVQLTAMALIAWGLHTGLQAVYGANTGITGWMASIVVGISLVMLLHPLVIGIDFLLAHHARSPIPEGERLTLWQALRTYDAELDASFRGFSWAHPFLSHRPAPEPLVVTEALPVLFIHGFFCNRAIWLPFMGEAARRGFRCEAVTLEPPFGQIDEYAPTIEAALDKLLKASGSEQAVLVCHSMGGLAARAWMRHYGDARVARLITLGTPHAGTFHARFSRSMNAVQMRLKSPWLEELGGYDIEKRSKITAIYSYHDNIVAPQDSASLAGAKNIALSGIGHVSLVYSRVVWDKVFEEIALLNPARSQH